MPTYDYECKNCGLQDEFFHSMTTKLDKCPECGSKKFSIVILQPPTCFNKEVKTLGQLAERNWKKMGKARQDEALAKDNAKEAQEFKEKRKLQNKLANATPEQKKKYIEHGTI